HERARDRLPPCADRRGPVALRTARRIAYRESATLPLAATRGLRARGWWGEPLPCRRPSGPRRVAGARVPLRAVARESRHKLRTRARASTQARWSPLLGEFCPRWKV